MQNKIESVVIFLLVAFVILLCAGIISMNVKSDVQQIEEWALQERYLEVVSVEYKHWFNSGCPYQYWQTDEDDRIYKVVVKNDLEKNEVKWFKFGVYQTEIKDGLQ